MGASTAVLFRLAGVAAILAGVLRALDAFVFKFLSMHDSEQLFLVTDIFLLFGLIGIYSRVANRVGWGGLAGFAAALVGILLVRSANGIIDAYVVGATIVAVGVAVMSVGALAARAFPRPAPILWIAALVAGLLAYYIESDWLFQAAGVSFGLGFVMAGAELLRRPGAA
jgi:hypothetical protein